jgi:hypothetical protein
MPSGRLGDCARSLIGIFRIHCHAYPDASERGGTWHRNQPRSPPGRLVSRTILQIGLVTVGTVQSVQRMKSARKKREPDCSQARFRFPESSTFSRVLTFGVSMARLSVRSDVCTSPPDKKPKKNRPAWVRALDSALFHVLATCSFLHARGYRFLRRYRLHPATLLLSLYVTSGALTMLPGDAKLVHGLIDIAIGMTHWLA